jgi:hypothetical protein
MGQLAGGRAFVAGDIGLIRVRIRRVYADLVVVRVAMSDAHGFHQLGVAPAVLAALDADPASELLVPRISW